ncbi:hypothetical protein V2J09_016390 [Rumex salicifolius]
MEEEDGRMGFSTILGLPQQSNAISKLALKILGYRSGNTVEFESRLHSSTPNSSRDDEGSGLIYGNSLPLILFTFTITSSILGRFSIPSMP